MSESRRIESGLSEENQRLRALVAQLEDRLDHMNEHGASALALQRSEDLHRLVMNTVSDVVLISDEAGKLGYVSPNSHYIFGRPPEEILRLGRIEAVLPRGLFEPDLLEQRRELTNLECYIRDSVGRSRNLSVNVRCIESPVGTRLFVCRDVTERVKLELNQEVLELTQEKRIEQQTRELRDSRDQYRRLVEGLRDEYFFYSVTAEGIIKYLSPSAYSILGYRGEQVIGRNWREFVDPTLPAYQHLEIMDRLRSCGVPTPSYAVEVPCASGEKHTIEFRDSVLRDTSGRIIAIEGIAKDVTELNRTQKELSLAREELEQRVRERTLELSTKNEQLRQTQERYLSVIQDHLDFIIRWSEGGTLTFVNDAFCSHCELGADKLIGANFLDAIHEEDRSQLIHAIASVSSSNPLITMEQRVTLPNGRIVWERWTHRALFDSEECLIEFQSIGSDITEHHRREEQAHVLTAFQQLFESLSDRERDVMRLVVAGNANKVVARKLGLSIKTIEKHRASLMRKLNIRSVPELVRLAMMIEDAS
ncbi:MAG: PAS domain S-box protein [Pirellulales bacterium]|nr:PAS domain S-box protein [Pirellulales bacterium]